MSNGPIFEWDPDKAQLNVRKHGISFEDARPVFRDVFSIEWLDETSGDEEERWIAVGMSQGRLLAVVYTERDEVLRIISARKADKRECDDYYQNQASK
jgi:uncharacterized DUF497 family protein